MSSRSIVAAALLDDMTITATGVVVAAIIFTVFTVVLTPVISAMVEKYADWLSIFVGAIVAYLALLITELLTDGLTIEGAGTWVLATVIVWLAGVVTTLIMLRLFRERLAK